MKGTPQRPDPRKPGTEIPIRINLDGPQASEGIEQVPARRGLDIRRMKVSTEMLEKCGYTEGCEGCRRKRAGMKEARPHSEACRGRITKALEGDEEGRELLRKDNERLDRRLFEAGEAMHRGHEEQEEDAAEAREDKQEKGTDVEMTGKVGGTEDRTRTQDEDDKASRDDERRADEM